MGTGGFGPPVRLWSRSELRRRWKGLVVLGVLAGVAAGLAIAAVDGASRSATAYERMHQQRDGTDVVYFPSQVRFDVPDVVTKLGTLPEVAAVGGFSLTASAIDGFPPGATPFVAVGPDWFTSIEQPKVLAGRLPDPQADDEAVVTEPVLHQGIHLGQELTWRNLSPEQGQQMQFSPPPDFDWVHDAKGPTTTLRVVGVVRVPLEAVASFASDGMLITGPGWAAAHLDQSARIFTNALVRLRHGGDDVAAFTADAARLTGRADIPVKDLHDDSKRVQSSIDVERTALLLFAAAVGLAAAVLVGQAFVRSVRAGADSVPVLGAMGLSRAGLVSGLTAPHLLTLLVALPVAVLSAVAFSTRFPIGLAGRIDPDLGVHVDALILVVGLAMLAAVIAGLVIGTSWLIVRAASAPRRPGRMRVIGAVGRTGAPLPAAVGASLALEAPPGRSSSSVRPVLIAGVAGVLAVVAAVTLVGGIDDALHRPQRVGTVWNLEVTGPEDVDTDAAVRDVAAVPDVVDVAMVYRGASVVDGVDAPIYALDQRQGSIDFVVLDGRAPAGRDEVMIGSRTARVAHAHVGETVKVGPEGDALHVVGIGLLVQTPHTSFDEGAWVSLDIYQRVIGTSPDESDQAALVRVRKGADVAKVASAIDAKGLDAEPPAPVPDVNNLAAVRSLPLYLAGFLVLLAAGAVAHALLTGARRRAHDLAVMRALGLTPRQTAGCVAWQATIIGAVALAIGVPLGLIVGREVWRVLTNALSFVYVGPLDVPKLVLIVPASITVLALLCYLPARGAARLRTAEVLRSE